ncbi:LOW QUALITY PROTEIN: gastrula zinc finger protein XlCGF52.1 [Drosophila nasuta]|uniref:LOW QUALITY PROTEIN: gastrula zinc finger protein XlCGF52.1 n=1 Tax=Drosophila nasuta TaxID=42062 RepID=UPI00295F37C4|nr:LOW QUALITY PROTEIN: gastrula zinc finger protein XlCGF52.1 [Drosophila nasuta]
MFPLLPQPVFIVCRCCLEEQPPLSHNFSENDQLNVDLLSLAPNLKIQSNDVICDPCLQRLRDALEFRQSCEESERILRDRHEQALDDAVELLKREVGETETLPILTYVEPVDFGNLDLFDALEPSYEPSLPALTLHCNDRGTLNTPLHLTATLETMEPPQASKLKRKRVETSRSRTPKSLRPCTECEKKFTRTFQLKLHLMSVHGLGNGLRYPCEVCSKSFASRHSLRYHVTSLHSTERPFACELCDRRFVLRTQLNSHARMHTGETKPRIFKCNICAKTWPTKSDLRTHMRSHDPDMSKRPFKCDKCEKAFYTRGHLSSHNLVHTGEKPHTCTYCKKSYQSVGNLNNHIVRQHSSELEEQREL